jgi:hypothetical protein
MKKNILFAASLLFSGLFGSFAFSEENRTIQDQIKSAHELEFIHCKPTQAQATDTVVHYIIDVKNTLINKLYVAPGLSTLKAAELDKITLIERRFTEVNTDIESDVSFKSNYNFLAFKLMIQDNDGQFLAGTVQFKSEIVPVDCHDIVIE